MSDLPPCPQCSCIYSYEMGALLVCPECSHEWPQGESGDALASSVDSVIRDTAGNVLADGHTVVVVKDLKVKGRPTSIKVGTKVRNIRLVRDNGDHDIDCKVDGFGAMYLKSSVVKKSV